MCVCVCVCVCVCYISQDLSEGDRANYEQNVQDAMASFPKVYTNKHYIKVQTNKQTCTAGTNKQTNKHYIKVQTNKQNMYSRYKQTYTIHTVCYYTLRTM